MADYYLLTRAKITASYITARRAHELYDEARTRPAAELRGNLESGFEYWTTYEDGDLKLVLLQFVPLRADQVPEPIRHRLADPRP
jgi:hypothetical protein